MTTFKLKNTFVSGNLIDGKNIFSQKYCSELIEESLKNKIK